MSNLYRERIIILERAFISHNRISEKLFETPFPAFFDGLKRAVLQILHHLFIFNLSVKFNIGFYRA